MEQKRQKYLLPDIDHPFEVKNRCAKHYINVVTEYSFVKIVDYPEIGFEMTYI